ncbi:MAG: response regulator transcription factor [Bacillota bacterium]
MSARILVVDDESRIRKIINDYLTNDGYTVYEAANGKDAVEKIDTGLEVDLVILDIMMPGKNGWQVCKEIKAKGDIPVIFLTALGEAADEAHGLDIGADDYIAKPFRYEVFMARVRTALRRYEKNNDAGIVIKDLEIIPQSRVVKKNGSIVDFSPKEYDLLIYLVNNKNIALERDKILDAVWGFDYFGDPRTVDTHIKNLRAKTDAFGECIKTVRGFGYRLEVE